MPVRLSMKTLVVTAVALGVLSAGGVLTYKTVRWKNFAEVSEGRVYRSGQLAGWQLERAIKKYGLRRVVALNKEKVDEEREICNRLGVEYYHFPMPSDGRGAPEQFTAVYRMLNETDSKPLLVHCNAGVARTGVAVALYRILYEGWSTEKALDELRGFERRGFMTVELQHHVRQMAVQVGDAVRR
jgi:protein tyrosine/serine phosphatase